MKNIVFYRVDENVLDKFDQLMTIQHLNDSEVIQELIWQYIEDSNVELNDNLDDDFLCD